MALSKGTPKRKEMVLLWLPNMMAVAIQICVILPSRRREEGGGRRERRRRRREKASMVVLMGYYG